ncbi:tyrosine-type recombinase/integrase [Bacteriovoracaceae bacterium]|nr:tyrosine-type recombinase/integrase [Bacteriovoracaceae bacterium]
MNQITPSLITSWVNSNVKMFKEKSHTSVRGNARRCTLDNEINLMKTIFNWYKQSIEFEQEAINLTCPIRKEHKKKGIIKPKPIKDMNITIEDAFSFFDILPQPFSDLAKLQYFTASRIGEVAGLQWNRINIDKNRMIIMETCNWDMQSKTYVGLNPTPKNKTPRVVHITAQIRAILERREAFKIEGNNFVFHIDGKPLNYGTILVNYRKAQRKTDLTCSGTHVLRHGMAKLARRVGGGLDAVIAMTGHKDIKLADHYSKLDNEYQKEVSINIMDKISLALNKNKTKDTILKFPEKKLTLVKSNFANTTN